MMVLGLALSAFTTAEAAKLTFKITNPDETAKVVLTFAQSNEQKEIAIDAAGNGSIEITDFVPQYVTMQYTRGRRTLYLDPKFRRRRSSYQHLLGKRKTQVVRHARYENAGRCHLAQGR